MSACEKARLTCESGSSTSDVRRSAHVRHPRAQQSAAGTALSARGAPAYAVLLKSTRGGRSKTVIRIRLSLLSCTSAVTIPKTHNATTCPRHHRQGRWTILLDCRSRTDAKQTANTCMRPSRTALGSGDTGPAFLSSCFIMAMEDLENGTAQAAWRGGGRAARSSAGSTPKCCAHGHSERAACSKIKRG